MFGLGMGEMILIGIIALVFIGPKKLPEMAKNLGKGIRDFQNAAKGFTDEVRSTSEAPQTEKHLAETPHSDETFQEDKYVPFDEAELAHTPESSETTHHSDKEDTSADIAGIPGKNDKHHS